MAAKEPKDTTNGRHRMTEGALSSRGSKREKEKRHKWRNLVFKKATSPFLSDERRRKGPVKTDISG